MAHDDKYDFGAVERKWQARWHEAKLYHADPDPTRPKFYGLEFFPYPSGAGLSVGHFKNYAPNDAFLRFKAMQGFNVLHPMGWDAFGLPAENEALKRARNPREMIAEYASTYRRQLDLIGMSYDWDREINSSDPRYYHWTQWIFLLLHRRGLAYRQNSLVNWCPKDKTALANEEVVNGRCQRCDTPVEKKPLPQWYLKITEYAERLLADLDTVDWPEGIKLQQRNWIGRSEGAEVTFQSGSHPITVFTTRPDTLWGATFLVLAPEHPLVPLLTAPEQQDAVEAYRARAARETEIDRQAEGRDKTGVFTGAAAVNPVNGETLPIWIADYVLMGYGTGAIMAVPAHDQRDFEFARKFSLPIVPVYQQPGHEVTGDTMTAAITDRGTLTNSGPFNGLSYTKETVAQVSAWLQIQNLGKAVVTYRFRDWLLSRQRYWGVPIPIIHCPTHGEVPVPEADLPVTLPYVERYEPSGTGESPLATMADWVNTTCPICHAPARRETDTMAGFACSSWYFLRFADPHNADEAFSPASVQYWLPVDTYVGGAEHAVMHLLYARFWTKVLYDAQLLAFHEPFTRLRNQGMMLAFTPGRKPSDNETAEEALDKIEDWVPLRPDEKGVYPEDKTVYRWVKMSKSLYNVVTPDEAAERYGADALRVYEMFVAPFEETVQWSEEGIRGSSKFLDRVFRLVTQHSAGFSPTWRERLSDLPDRDRPLRRKTHQTLAKVAEDIENFRFNTAVASLMEWVNTMYASANALSPSDRSPALDEAIEFLVIALAPMAPHLADELWNAALGQMGFLYRHPWPHSDPEVAKNDEITLVVQVNGKVRDKITAPADADNTTLETLALGSPRLEEFLHGGTPKKVIVVPGKLVNIVI